MFHVEHFDEAFVRLNICILASFLCLSLMISGCSQPRPNPELVDPIYSDLLKEADGYEKAAVEAEKKHEEAKLELSKMGPREPQRNGQTRIVYNAEREATQLKQMALYYKIRAEQRKEFDQSDYLKAFNAGKGDEWPPREEYQAYLLRKKLQSAPRNWEERVPKMVRYNKGYSNSVAKKGDEKGEKKSAEGGGEAKSGH
jgi:hypothetical protein